MSKIVLCIDYGNFCLKQTEHDLTSHDCKVYTLSCGADCTSAQRTSVTESTDGEAFSIREENARAVLSEIEEAEGHIDILLFGVSEQIPEDGVIGTKHNCEALLEILGAQISSVQDIIEAALPLLRRGETKRIGMITKKESGISGCRDDRNYGQHMAWAGLNMTGRLYFNLLRPEGFTFRWYCAEENAGGMSAGEYLLRGLCYDPKEPYLHSDENRFVMRDSYLREISW